jgi:hypothetical protein
MVTIEEIQAAYYMVAATGVLVAAVYYVISMRYNMKAREMEIARLFYSDSTSEEGMQKYATIMTFEWKDYDDFMKKYGYSNPEMFGKWTSYFFTMETIGLLQKSGVIDSEKIYALGGYGAIRIWEKFKDIIQGRRGISWGHDYMANAEYIAGEMLKIKLKHDTGFKEKLPSITKT